MLAVPIEWVQDKRSPARVRDRPYPWWLYPLIVAPLIVFNASGWVWLSVLTWHGLVLVCFFPGVLADRAALVFEPTVVVGAVLTQVVLALAWCGGVPDMPPRALFALWTLYLVLRRTFLTSTLAFVSLYLTALIGVLWFCWSLSLTDLRYVIWALFTQVLSLTPTTAHDAPIHAVRKWPFWRHVWTKWLGHEVRDEQNFTAASAETPTIFVCYPHGVAPLGTMATFALPGRPSPRPRCWPGIATTPVHLETPLLAPLLAAGGAVSAHKAELFAPTDDWSGACACDRPHQGPRPVRDVVILPDGIPGMLAAEPGVVELALPHPHRDPVMGPRAGFLQIAFQRRLNVQPVYNMGEAEDGAVWRLRGPPWLEAFYRWSGETFGSALGVLICVVPSSHGRGAVRTVFGRSLSPMAFASYPAFHDAFFAELARLVRQHTPFGARYGPHAQQLLTQYKTA